MASVGAGSVAGVTGELFDEHRRFLWGLCYRMTGSAADAEDLVQETFVRAIERPPERLDAPWRPWLVRVAMNLARDAYRRRRRRGYSGEWLPAPVETPLEEEPGAFEPEIGDGRTTEGRYELLESVSVAFLLALEALKPRERAVLLLREVFDYDVRATAEALEMSEANVKTTHHRARRAMAAYDARAKPSVERSRRTEEVLERFLGALALGDVRAIESLLADGVRSVTDSGGAFSAAHNVVVGRSRVARLSLGLARKLAGSVSASFRRLNGAPAAILEVAGASGRTAPRIVFRIELADDGRIVEIQSVLASRKLAALA